MTRLDAERLYSLTAYSTELKRLCLLVEALASAVTPVAACIYAEAEAESRTACRVTFGF